MKHANTTGARVILRADLPDAEGEPRPCIALPGRKLPLAFPRLADALAALREMEERYDRR
jgi:hypothetical protein